MEKIPTGMDSQAYMSKIEKICSKYNFGNPKDKIKVRTNGSKAVVELNIKPYFFPNKDYFYMRFFERADISNLTSADIIKYTYHGQYQDSHETDFIRFDFEPNTRKFAPMHINADEKKWGNHLSFPDGTNLDISKMDIEKAIRVFSLYSENRGNYPLDKDTNHEYVTIIEGDDNNE